LIKFLQYQGNLVRDKRFGRAAALHLHLSLLQKKTRTRLMDFTRILLVGVGGFLGSVARYVVVKSVDARLIHSFPFGTFVVNLTGCFFLGLIAGMLGRQVNGGEAWRAFLGVGFCGGFTTFSAFALENHNLLADRLVSTAVLYIVASVVSGILAVLLGQWCTRFL
jgi:fluoride exporter